MISDVIKLIKYSTTKDANGIDQKTETAREIFAEVRSIGAGEWHNATRDGLNPEYEFIVFFADYENEKTVEYNGAKYSIYRRYRDNDRLELYCELRGGANGTA